jgi:hypothetical protein
LDSVREQGGVAMAIYSLDDLIEALKTVGMTI